MAGEATLGHFERQAARITGNAKLYDLVQEIAHSQDQLVGDMAEVKAMLRTLVERPHGSAKDLSD